MHVIYAQNVNDAYRQGLKLILSEGQRTDSRNGPVLRLPEPVSTVYSMPQERVLFDTKRNANPFFHLFEALWMLNGGNDVETMDGFLKSLKQFSDDGKTYHGAYGDRWRHWPDFGLAYDGGENRPLYRLNEFDQIQTAIEMLRENPFNRRVVISMWDPSRDLDIESKDIPCNDMIKLWIDRDYRLHMVVFNRSNDIVWGCYGANAVQMSILHEYLSTMTHSQQGTLTQISCDFHAYLDTPYNVNTFIPETAFDDVAWRNPYEDEMVCPYRLVTNRETFDAELRNIMSMIRDERSLRDMDPQALTNHFFVDIVLPMHQAWEYVRRKDYPSAKNTLWNARRAINSGGEVDWLIAAHQWIALRDKE
jgi:thymidylate synthase